MELIIVLVICTQLIGVTIGQNGRQASAMNDICNRSPGTSLCQWYQGGRRLPAQDPRIEARPDPSHFREREPPLTSSSGASASDKFERNHPKPPVLPLPEQANEDQRAYCDRYKTSFTYYCDKRDNDNTQFAVINFCSFYKKSCTSGSSVAADPKSEPPSPPAADKPKLAPTKPPFPAAQAKDVAKMCTDYKSVADAYCKGKVEGLTKSSCEQYQYYCANFKPDPPKPAVPAGATEYCGTYAATYSKWCSGERPTPEKFVRFCTGYNQICSALVGSPPKPPAATPNFGDNQNPLSPGFQGPKSETFGGGNNPLVNPAGNDPNSLQSAGPIVPGGQPAKVAPAPEAVPAPAPPPPAANAPLPSWPGIGKGPNAFPQPPNDVPPSPFSPVSSGGGRGGGPPPSLGVGSSQSTGFGPGGFGSSSGTQAGPIGVSSGSSTNFGGLPGLGSLGNFGSSQGMGLGPGGIGSTSNTQAGPIGVSSGSGVGLGGGGNIPGLGAIGNGGADPISSLLGKRRRR